MGMALKPMRLGLACADSGDKLPSKPNHAAKCRVWRLAGSETW